jgi:hypothetical protein
MPSDQDEVRAGAVIAAMELVKGLGSDENAMPGHELLSLIRDASVSPWGADTGVRPADRLVHAHGRSLGLGGAPHPQAPGTVTGPRLLVHRIWALWGRTVLYSILQSSTSTWASSRG